jgi:ABC-2 type transport system permease protein
MRGYLALTAARFRVLLQYRAAAIAGIATQLFWGLIRMMIFLAFYSSSTRVQPMSRADMVTYIWLGQAMLGLLPWNFDNEVRNMLRTGAVAYELVRPLDLYAHWYCRAFAQRVAPTLMRSVPLFLVAMLWFGMRPPPSFSSGLAWLLTTFGAALLNTAFMTLVTLTMFWTLSGEGIQRIAPFLVYMFSGMLLPLALWPAWAQPTLHFLPFRGMVDVPFRVYLGQTSPSQALVEFAIQLLWTTTLVLTGRVLLARGTHRLVVQGG